MLWLALCLRAAAGYYTGYHSLGDSCGCFGASQPANCIDTCKVTLVTSFFFGSCAYTSYDRVKCWGFQDNPILAFRHRSSDVYVGSRAADLGNELLPVWLGSTEKVRTPGGFATSGAKNVRHMCVVTTAGQVKCWGDGRSGALGQESSQDIGVAELRKSPGEGNSLQAVKLMSASGGDAGSTRTHNVQQAWWWWWWWWWW